MKHARQSVSHATLTSLIVAPLFGTTVTRPIDLNDVKSSYSARLESAKDINDSGEITGRAIDASNARTACFGTRSAVNRINQSRAQKRNQLFILLVDHFDVLTSHQVHNEAKL